MENIKCVYGCNKDAKYTLKNGKYCCSKNCSQCPNIKLKNSNRQKEAYASGKRKPLDHKLYINKMSWRKNQNSFSDLRIKSKYKNSDIFCQNSVVSKSILRKRIKDYNLIPLKCSGENCNIINEWLEKYITLELDHINGINTDHRIENLRFLCPNCHSQTPTFRKTSKKEKYSSKKISNEELINKINEGLNNNQIINYFNIGTGNYDRLRKLRLKIDKEKKLICTKCDSKTKGYTKSGLCTKCSKKAKRKIDRPSTDILIEEISLHGYSAIGRKYGVSDNAIRKWIKIK